MASPYTPNQADLIPVVGRLKFTDFTGKSSDTDNPYGMVVIEGEPDLFVPLDQLNIRGELMKINNDVQEENMNEKLIVRGFKYSIPGATDPLRKYRGWQIEIDTQAVQPDHFGLPAPAPQPAPASATNQPAAAPAPATPVNPVPQPDVQPVASVTHVTQTAQGMTIVVPAVMRPRANPSPAPEPTPEPASEPDLSQEPESRQQPGGPLRERLIQQNPRPERSREQRGGALRERSVREERRTPASVEPNERDDFTPVQHRTPFLAQRNRINPDIPLDMEFDSGLSEDGQQYYCTFRLFQGERVVPGSLTFLGYGSFSLDDKPVRAGQPVTIELPAGRFDATFSTKKRKVEILVTIDGWNDKYRMRLFRRKPAAIEALPEDKPSRHFFNDWQYGRGEKLPVARFVFALAVLTFLLLPMLLVGSTYRAFAFSTAIGVLTVLIGQSIIAFGSQSAEDKQARARAVGFIPRLVMGTNNRWALVMVLMVIFSIVTYWRTPAPEFPKVTAEMAQAQPTTDDLLRELDERLVNEEKYGDPLTNRELALKAQAKAQAEYEEALQQPGWPGWKATLVGPTPHAEDVQNARWWMMWVLILLTLPYIIVAGSDEVARAFYATERSFRERSGGDTRGSKLARLLQSHYGQPAVKAPATTAADQQLSAPVSGWAYAFEFLKKLVGSVADDVAGNIIADKLPTLIKMGTR